MLLRAGDAKIRADPRVARAHGVHHAEDGMLKIGDVVVTMSHPGPFTIVDIKGDALTIVTAQGLQKVVRSANVRALEKAKPAPS
ncbi:MAG: hypothetical protein HY271_06245 [Deltaproteobacteria bacterium]|nr:hypothetical protein [Deltaproteobacteria bacterium]